MPDAMTVRVLGLKELQVRLSQARTRGIADQRNATLRDLARVGIDRLRAETPRGKTTRGRHLADSYAVSAVQEDGRGARLTISNTKLVSTKAGGRLPLLPMVVRGTRPHNIPNSFGWGMNVGTSGRFGGYWHPGTRPNPIIERAMRGLNVETTLSQRARQIAAQLAGKAA